MISSNFLVVLLKHRAFYSLTLNKFENVIGQKIVEVPEEDFDFEESELSRTTSRDGVSID